MRGCYETERRWSGFGIGAFLVLSVTFAVSGRCEAADDAATGSGEIVKLASKLWIDNPPGQQRDEKVQTLIAMRVERDGASAVDEIASDRLAIRTFDGGYTYLDFAMHRLGSTDIDAVVGSKTYRELLKMPARASAGNLPAFSLLVLEKYPARVGQLVHHGIYTGDDHAWRRAGAAIYNEREDWHAWLTEWGSSSGRAREPETRELSRGIASEILAKTERDEVYTVATAFSEKEEEKKRGRFGRALSDFFHFSRIFRESAGRHLVATDLAFAKELSAKVDDYHLDRAITTKLAAADMEGFLHWYRASNRKIKPSASSLKPLLKRLTSAEAVAFFNDVEISDGPKAYLRLRGLREAKQIVDELQPLPASAARDALLWEVAIAAAEHRPEHFFDLMDSVSRDQWGRFAKAVLDRVGRRNPKALGAAIVSNAEHPFARFTATALVERWSEFSERAAWDWVRGLPAGLRDAGATILIEAIAPHDVASALKRAAELHGKEARTASIAHCLALWMERDPAGAKTAARDLGLPADERAEVARRVQSEKR